VDYIERMEVELRELQEKIEKGGKFYFKEFENPKFLDKYQIRDLGQQIEHMKLYETDLKCRIAYAKNK